MSAPESSTPLASLTIVGSADAMVCEGGVCYLPGADGASSGDVHPE